MPTLVSGITKILARFSRIGREAGTYLSSDTSTLLTRCFGKSSLLAQTWTTRSMALWVLVLLLGYLILYAPNARQGQRGPG